MIAYAAGILGEMQPAQAIFLLALIVTIGILLVRSRSYFAKKAREPRGSTQRPAAYHAATGHFDSAKEFERWEVQMHDLGRELIGRIDSKMVVLEQLIRDADEATARLQSSLGKPNGARASVDASPSRANRSTVAKSQEPADAFHGAYAPDTNAGDPRYQDIYKLADQGLASPAIAQRIGSPVGEVDLILSLRKDARG